MKISTTFIAVLLMFSILSCNKSSDSASQISLTASTEQATIGQTIAVTLSSSANVSRWTVQPSTAAKAFTITTSKTNYFTFNQAGTYTIGVSAKALAYDSTAHQSLDSCWNSAKTKSCVKGIDSTSINITVVK